jgi:primase-polymerase (primpol)-like protein
MRGCEVCEAPVATPARGRRPRFCSTRCRVAAHRAGRRVTIPVELRSRDRWVLHVAKRPMAVGGWWCSVNDPSAWSTFDDVSDAGTGDGFGFVLNGDGVVCIDLDDCVVDGVVSAEAQALVDSLPRTFVELSPSGRGLHVWGFGDVSHGRKIRSGGLKVEVYGGARFMTVTGRAVVDAPFAELDLSELVGCENV